MKNLKNKLKSKSGINKAEIEKVTKEIEKNKRRLKNTQILMLDGKLNPNE